LDLRPLYTLYEHKKCMYQRMQYIFNNNYIKEMPDVLPALKAIEQSASVLYKLQLKYQFSSNNNILAEIINKLSEIEAAEKQVLERILEEIRRTIDLKAIV
ncbi:MAG: hypothetical protein Q8920_16950, partial [Bacillota bacterium]|nr:hypothetical protein [Bacillota bacterium]